MRGGNTFGLLCGLVLKHACCYLMIRVQAFGSVAGYALTHVDDMLGAADNPILHLFVDALKKEWEITQSKTIGQGKEGEITYTGMWIAAMSGGGSGIHQCPYVSDVLKSWGMSDCRTISHSWKS